MSDEEFRNQTGIINIDEFDYLKVAIIGCGSIGSFLAFALNKIGFRNIILIDDDTIESHNIPTQFYLKGDVGQFKVETLSSYLDGNITTHITKVKPSHRIKADIVFICVDSLSARKLILHSLLSTYETHSLPKLIIDGRMNRLVFRIYTIPMNNQQLLNQYTQSLLEPEFEGPCTEKGIIQNVYAIVATMIEQTRKIMLGLDFSPVLNCDFEHYFYISSHPSDTKVNLQKPKETQP